MAIAFVGASTALDHTGTPAASVATPALSVTTGNLIVVGVRFAVAGAITGVTDTAGNTYVQRATITHSNSTTIEIWTAENITGNANNVVTATYSPATLYWSIFQLEYSGIATSSSLDATSTAQSASAPITSGTFSTAQADEVIVSYSDVSNVGSTWTLQTGYTQREIDSDGAGVFCDKIVSSIQSNITVSHTPSPSTSCEIVVCTLKAAAVAVTGRVHAYIF